MIVLDQEIAGADKIQQYLNQFFVKHLYWAPPHNIYVFGHNNTQSKADIIICTPESIDIANFVQNTTSLIIKLGPIGDIDGQGHNNWISFRRKLRVSDPRSVARCSLLALLALHHLIVW